MLRLGVLLAIALIAQQAPPNTAIIVGRVVDERDGKPVSGALVELVSTGSLTGIAPSTPVTPRRQSADSQGRFVFRELGAGSYSLRATTGGTGFSPNGFIQSATGFRIGAYLDGGYGQRRPGGPIQPLLVAEGQMMPDVVVRLWRGATVSGTILDDLGEPVVDTVVGVAEMSTDGRLVNGPTVRTDDRGSYRVSALSPGRYIVFVPQTTTSMSAESADEALRKLSEIAVSQSPGAAPRVVPELTGFRIGSSLVKTASAGLITGNIAPRRTADAVFVFQTTFHPSATTLASAAAIELGGGDERNGVDVVMQPVRAAPVSGTIFTGGSPAGAISLRLVPGAGSPDAAMFDVATTRTDALGRFVFPLVPAGNYTLLALNEPVRPLGPTAGVVHSEETAGGPGAWLAEPVGVGPDGVANLAFSLKSGLTLRGQFEFTGSTPRPSDAEIARLMFSVRSASPRARVDVANGGANAAAVAGRTFAAIGIPPGRYVLRASGLPASSPWRIQSVLVGGREMNDVPFDVAEDIDNVQVTFSDRPAAVGGRVSLLEPGDPSIAVLLFPSNRAYWSDARAMTQSFRLARTTVTGEFSIPDVPPGEYFVVAVFDTATAPWPDVSFLTRSFPEATSLRVAAGERPTVSLTVKVIR